MKGWNQFRRVAVSLPLAIFAGLIIVSINEFGYKQTNQALDDLRFTHEIHNAVVHLREQMVDADTGLRGYLLTHDTKYLQPYLQASDGIAQAMQDLQTLVKDAPVSSDLYAKLVHSVTRKIAEMEFCLQLFREGKSEALQFVIFTDMGEQDMNKIRMYSHQLLEQSVRQSQRHQKDIQDALFLSRLGIAIVTIIGILAFYMYLRQTNILERTHQREQIMLSNERNRLEELVRQRTAKLTELANHLQQVREDERGHLARELHDELGALLTAAKLDVARLKSRIDMENAEVSQRVQHLTETLNGGIALKRRIIEDLRPSSLSNLGLCTALEILTNDFAQRSGIEMERNLETVELADATELTIYRLVQESLTNISKYAQASKVIVLLQNRPSHVEVQIRDDGQGFNIQEIRPNAHGLEGMRYRVEAAGGKLSIQTAMDSGTTITAIIPKIQPPDTSAN